MKALEEKYVPLTAIILAGGKGTRMQGVGDVIPKPMLLVNGKPMLWHIIDRYHKSGVRNFIIATGHRHEIIDDWVRSSTDAQFSNSVVLASFTGEDTQTGGRIKKLLHHVGAAPFHMTYGDGLANIDVADMSAAFKRSNSLVMLCAVNPVPRFGVIRLGMDRGWKVRRVEAFSEKNYGDTETKINGGFMIIDPKAGRYIDGDKTNFESDVLPALAKRGLVSAYTHDGFWKCVDAPRDLEELNKLGRKGEAPWIV